MLVLLFALIDFGRMIYEKQIMVNISREGANLASRGNGNTQLQIMSNAVVMRVIQSGSPLDLDSNMGEVIISAVNNSNNIVMVTAQIAQGGFSAPSKIGQVGQIANMPDTGTITLPAPNQTIYVSEVFYTYVPITPLFKLMNFSIPSTNYDVAYF